MRWVACAGRVLCLAWLLWSAPAAGLAIDCGLAIERARQAHATQDRAAIPVLLAARQAGCDAAELFLFLGALQGQTSDRAAAIAVFQAGVDRYPAHLGLSLELASTLALHGRLADALAVYERLLQRDPHIVPAQLGKARVLLWLERSRESLAIYRAVLARTPKQLEAMRGLAAASLALLSRRQAQALYQEILRRHPEDTEAQSGLRQTQQLALAELSLQAGISGAPSVDLTPIAALQGSLRLTPRQTLLFRYQLDAPIVIGERGSPAGIRHRGELGLSSRLGRWVELGLGYQLAVLATTVRHAWPVELAVKLPRSWVLLSSARAGIDHQGQGSLLVSLGVQYHFRVELWLMGQVFRYDDTSGEQATAGVGTLHLPLLDRWHLKLGGVYGHYRAGDLFGAFGESWWRLQSRLDLGVMYQYSAGFLEQHAAAVALRWRV
jgi:tetratricopeptide (TPR) repeat protein